MNIKLKILFINLPYYGHVVPTIGLVQELIQQGCEVTYLMPFGWEEKVTESGAKFHGYQNHRQLSEQIKYAYAAAESIVQQFDLVIYEQFFFLGKHLAEKYQKPVVRIFTAPVTNKKLMDQFISAKGPLSIFKHKWIARAFTKDIAKDIPLKTDNWLDEIIYNPPELNLVYTLREYQPYEEEFSDKQYKFLGPSIYERKEQSFDFVKGAKPVIYVSLGTILKGAVSFFRMCIDIFRDENADVILSVGKKFDVSKLKNIPENVHIYKSVPQIKVLKMADVFVTHGGMNSVSEAFAYGVPMVVIPFVSDQPVNAEFVEKLGVGKKLEYKNIDKELLKTTVFDMLEAKNVRENLNKVQDRIRKAPGNAGGAKMIIEYYEDAE
jgi:MGT family glycosyltransferase